MNTTAFTSALLSTNTPDGLRMGNASDPATRLAVYRNNVFASLTNVLADSFPVTRALVGEEFFRCMAQQFIRLHPPRSPLLVRYGMGADEDSLVVFIANFPPAAGVPYLSDVAKLEAARIHAYHAADETPLEHKALTSALNSSVEQVRIRLHPSVQILASPFAIASLWFAHHGIVDISSVDPYSPEQALVLRDELDVLVLTISPGDATFINSVHRGETLQQAVSAAESHSDFDLTRAMQGLIRHRAIIHLSTE